MGIFALPSVQLGYASASGMMERPRSWKSKVPIQNLCFGDEKEMDRRHLNPSPRFRDLADFIYFLQCC